MSSRIRIRRYNVVQRSDNSKFGCMRHSLVECSNKDTNCDMFPRQLSLTWNWFRTGPCHSSHSMRKLCGYSISVTVCARLELNVFEFNYIILSIKYPCRQQYFHTSRYSIGLLLANCQGCNRAYFSLFRTPPFCAEKYWFSKKRCLRLKRVLRHIFLSFVKTLPPAQFSTDSDESLGLQI